MLGCIIGAERRVNASVSCLPVVAAVAATLDRS